MIIQELYRHDHTLSTVSHIVWAAYVVPAFVLALLSQSLIFHGMLIILYTLLIIRLARITILQLFRLYKIPLLFILIGCLTVALSFHSSEPVFSVGGLSIGFAKGRLVAALEILFRSLAVISIVYFGLLTRTISEIAEIMHACYVPKILIELFVLTYKFIFNLVDTITRMIVAQKSRLAYTGYGGGFQALTWLLSAMFRRSVEKSMQLEMVTKARMGSGDFLFVGRRKSFEKGQLVAPLLLSTGLLCGFLLLNIYG